MDQLSARHCSHRTPGNGPPVCPTKEQVKRGARQLHGGAGGVARRCPSLTTCCAESSPRGWRWTWPATTSRSWWTPSRPTWTREPTERARGAVAVQANADVFRQAKVRRPGPAVGGAACVRSNRHRPRSARGEASSDQTIATIAKGAAVAINLADSDTSGLGFAKPVTSALRGAALLPYWAITGAHLRGTPGPRPGHRCPGCRRGPARPRPVRPRADLGRGGRCRRRPRRCSPTPRCAPAPSCTAQCCCCRPSGFLAWAGYRYQQKQADAAGTDPATTPIWPCWSRCWVWRRDWHCSEPCGSRSAARRHGCPPSAAGCRWWPVLFCLPSSAGRSFPPIARPWRTTPR